MSKIYARVSIPYKHRSYLHEMKTHMCWLLRVETKEEEEGFFLMIISNYYKWSESWEQYMIFMYTMHIQVVCNSVLYSRRRRTSSLYNQKCLKLGFSLLEALKVIINNTLFFLGPFYYYFWEYWEQMIRPM